MRIHVFAFDEKHQQHLTSQGLRYGCGITDSEIATGDALGVGRTPKEARAKALPVLKRLLRELEGCIAQEAGRPV